MRSLIIKQGWIKEGKEDGEDRHFCFMVLYIVKIIARAAMRVDKNTMIKP